MRSVPVFVLLCFSSLLFAEPLHRSNALGQDLGALLQGEVSEWTLSGSVLSHDGTPVFEREMGLDTRTVKNLETGEVTKRTYQNGRLVKEEQKGELSVFLYDEEGRLSGVKKTDGRGQSDLTLYTYDRASGNLSAVIETEKTSTFYPSDGTFTTSDGSSFERYERIGDGYVLRTHLIGSEAQKTQRDVFVDAEGNVTVSQKNGDETTEETYDDDGDVIHRVVSVGQETKRDESYVYENGTLRRAVIQEDGEIAISDYEDGTITEMVRYQGGDIEKTVRFSDGVMTEETVYSKGIPYAVITYKQDGKSVGGVRYL